MKENKIGPNDVQQGQKRSGCGCFEWGAIIVVAIIAIFIAVAVPGFMRTPSMSHFTACMEQLSHVKTGIDAYLSDRFFLYGVDVPDDVCHYILPGYDNATDCKGKVQERIDSKKGVCKEGSFEFNRVGATGFEITAVSKEKKHCEICVTEVTTTPEKYSDCSELGRKIDCVHKKDKQK